MWRRSLYTLQKAGVAAAGSGKVQGSSETEGAEATARDAAPKLSKIANPIRQKSSKPRFIPSTDRKTSKAGGHIAKALEKDRQIVAEMRGRSLIQTLREIHWKAGIGFMLFWTWLGYWLIPKFKRWQEAVMEPDLPKSVHEELHKDPPPLQELFTRAPKHLPAQEQLERIEKYEKRKKEAWEKIQELREGTYAKKEEVRQKSEYHENRARAIRERLAELREKQQGEA